LVPPFQRRAQQRAHAQLLHLLFAQNLDFKAQFGQRLGGFG